MPAEQKEEARERRSPRRWRRGRGPPQRSASGSTARRRPGSRTTYERSPRPVGGSTRSSFPRPRAPADLQRADGAALRGGAGGGPRPADRTPGPDRVRQRAARRERDRRGDAAPRGPDPGAGGHERLARLRLAARRGPAGTSSAAPCSSPPAPPGCRRSTAPISRSPTPRGCAPLRRARASSASTESGRFTPIRSSRSNELFSPSPEEVEQARAILDALASAGDGAVMLDGEMIDEASRKRAEALLARATPRRRRGAIGDEMDPGVLRGIARPARAARRERARASPR